MQQRRLQVSNGTVGDDALGVSVLNVGRCFTSVQDGDWWIDPAVQFSAVNAVNEFRTVARGAGVWFQTFQLVDHVAGHDVVGVERQYPRSLDTSLAQSEFPLIAMAIKRALKQAHL